MEFYFIIESGVKDKVLKGEYTESNTPALNAKVLERRKGKRYEVVVWQRGEETKKQAIEKHWDNYQKACI